jgi:hypothetical protein
MVYRFGQAHDSYSTQWKISGLRGGPPQLLAENAFGLNTTSNIRTYTMNRLADRL